MSERHLREARDLTEPDEHGVITVQLMPHTREASVRSLAAALEAAELRGVRAGLAAARERVFDAAAAIHNIDPASVDVEP